MLMTHIAIVPLEKEEAARVPLQKLLPIAAAVQIQVQRDLGPSWGVHGTVSAFPSLEDVPGGYWPVAVTRQAVGVDGFHYVMKGLPFGLVEDGDDLSVGLSHEIIEMLIDVYGARAAAGPKIGAPGEMVDYVIEVCDPCESSSKYEINGLEVSDFVLPGFYTMSESQPGSYSFTGAVKLPRTVLEGGYLTFRDPFPGGTVYQVFALPEDDVRKNRAAADPRGTGEVSTVSIGYPDGSQKDLTIAEMPTAPNRVWRELMAELTNTSPNKARGKARSAANAAEAAALAADGNFADTFRANIAQLTKAMRAKVPPPSINEVLSLMEDLVGKRGELKTFREDRAQRTAHLKRIGVTKPPTKPPKETQSETAKRYKEVVKYLKQQEQLSGIFGPELDPNLSFWMFMLMP